MISLSVDIKNVAGYPAWNGIIKRNDLQNTDKEIVKNQGKKRKNEGYHSNTNVATPIVSCPKLHSGRADKLWIGE